jgi:hypothetical protein
MGVESVQKSKVPAVVKTAIEKTTSWNVYKLHSDNRAWHRRRKFVLGGMHKEPTLKQRTALVANIEVELSTNQLQYDSVGMVKLKSNAYGTYWAIIVNTRF